MWNPKLPLVIVLITAIETPRNTLNLCLKLKCNFGDTKRKYFKDEPITYWHAWEASWSVWKPKMSLSCSHSLGLVLSPRPSCPFILSSTFLSDLQELI